MTKIKILSCDVKIHVEFPEQGEISKRDFQKATLKFRKEMIKLHGYKDLPPDHPFQPTYYFTYNEID